MSTALKKNRVDNKGVITKREVVSRLLGELLPNQQIGLEFEAEYDPNKGPSGQYRFGNAEWAWTEDQSLRNGLEYRSNGPRPAACIEQDIRVILDFLVKHKAQASMRTSIHAHLDFSDYDSDELKAFLVLAILLEPTMFNYVGAARERLLFCQRMADTNVPTLCVAFLDSGKTKDLPGEALRYSGLNLASLVEHGTIEFRHMPLSFDVSYILAWMELLVLMKSFCYKESGYSAQRIVTLNAEGSLRQALFRNWEQSLAAKMQWVNPPERETAIATAICFGQLKYPSIEIDDNFKIKMPEGW